MKTVSTQELAQRVAQELSAPETQTRAVLERAIEVMRKELQRGNRIDLPSFISVSIKQGQAVASKSASKASLHLPAARLVQMDLDESLRKKNEGSGQDPSLLGG